LLPTTVSKREALETQKIRLRSIWEISFIFLHRMPIPSHWWRQFFWGGCATEAWNRAALWVPFCTPFITMTWTDSWLYREVLPLPWIQLKSLTAVIMLMTLLSLQTRL
jgi:hypothetical protein